MLLLIHKTWHEAVSPSHTWHTLVCWTTLVCAALAIREKGRAHRPDAGDGPPSPPANP